MENTPSIANMKAKAIVIMATRRQDQDLVTEVASKYGVDEHAPTSSATTDDDWRGVVPSYGWHPWFSHQIYDDKDAMFRDSDAGKLTDEQKIAHYASVLTPSPETSESRDFLIALPEPLPLSQLISDTRSRLSEHPLALVGEVGLDRGMRIPEAWLPGQAKSRDETLTPGGREGRKLSPYKVSMEHQRKILLAQLRLAGEMGRAVSVHGVQCHGVLYETLRECWKGYERQPSSKRERKRMEREAKDEKRADNDTNTSNQGNNSHSKSNLPYPPRICLHSYSGPAEQAKLYLAKEVPAKMFFSFSLAINFSTSARDKTEEVIKMVPNEQILIESDLHIAGDRMDANLKGMAEKVCELKGWDPEEGVRRLRANWMSFVFGESGEGGEEEEEAFNS